MATSKRFATILMAKINKLLGRVENPIETLEYSYEKQKDLLTNVKNGMVEVTEAKKKLEAHKSKLEKEVPKLDAQAKEVMRQGNDALARSILERKASTLQELQSLDEQIKQLSADHERLVQNSKLLENKIQQLASSKETIKAQYTAAEARMKINESLSGLGNEVGNVGEAMERAKDKTEQMAARSDAIDELMDSGVINDPIDNTTSFDREIANAKKKSDVDNEFRRMKRLELLRKNDLNVFRT